MITDFAITSADLGDSSVGSTQIAAGAVGSSEIADGSVAATDMQDGAALGEILDDDGSESGLDADLLDGYHGSSYTRTSQDYGRSGVASNLYEGTSTLTSKYVNATGDTMSGSTSSSVLSVTNTGTGRGVYGFATNTGDVSNYGGYFLANGSSGGGVLGFATGTSGRGVYGETTGANGHGVSGSALLASAHAGYFVGDVFIYGNYTATGTKSFAHPHPTDPSREIVYVCLEGGESGVYVRGSGRLKEGRAEVELPEHFALVAVKEGLTVQITPKNGKARGYLYVEEVTPGRIVVVEAGGGTSDACFDYVVMGVRRGFEDHQVIRENRHVKPDRNMSRQEYEEWMSLPKNKGMQKLLIENSTLTPEGKINQDTATKLGWKLGPETKAEMMEKISPRGPEVEENARQ